MGTQSRQAPASFADVAAATIASAIAASLFLLPLGYLLVPVIELPAPFRDHHQTAETMLFILVFVVILPISVWLVPRVAARIAAVSPSALSGMTALGCVALIGGLLAVKLSERLPWEGGLAVLLVVVSIWWIAIGGLAASVSRGVGVGLLERVGSHSREIWWLSAVLLMVTGTAFAFLDSVSVVVLLFAAALAGAALVAYIRFDPPQLGRWGLAADIVALVLVFLAVPNLVIVRPEVASDAFLTSIIQFHQNFFLGPASHVLGGGAMLVDTFSQYGVGSIDFIAGWFAIAGTSNGTLGLLDGLLDGLVFAGAYFVVRVAGVSRPLAMGGLAVAIIVLVLGLVYPVGGLLQHGAIRFGMPMFVLVAAAVALRFPRFAKPARFLMVLLVGISSVWALEAFAYTTLTFAVVVLAEASLRPEGERLRTALRFAGAAVGACVFVHVVFALTTLVTVGSWPQWGHYASTLHEFLVGGIGDLTYDFSPWSPGIGVGAVYLASAIAVALLVIRQRDTALRERTTIVLLSGSTAYGVALFSYLVNRSSDHIVPYVSLPAVMVVLIWLGLMLRSPERISRSARAVVVALALGVSALMVSIAWSSVDLRFSQSALAHVIPGGESVGGAINRLRNLPPLSSGAEEAERLLDLYWPGEDESLVVLEPDLGVEALARTDRINALPLSDPWEDSLVADQRIEDVDAALSELTPGERILLDRKAIEAFEAYRRDPSLDPLAPSENQTIVPSGLAILQQYALSRIGERYRLRIVARGADDLFVAELVPR